MKKTQLSLILCLLAALPALTLQAQDRPSGPPPGGMGGAPGGGAPRFSATPKDTTEMTEKEKAKLRKKLAKAEAKQAKLKAEEAANAPREDEVVYLFGVSTNLNDTIVYFSDVVAIPYVRLQKKTKFLPYRSEYSLQMREYLEGTLGEQFQTVAIFFSDKEKKVKKRFAKMQKRMADEGYGRIVVVAQEDFTFKKPDWDNVAI